MLSQLSGYPIALIGADDTYQWVTDGWVEAYSPDRTALWWIGRDHPSTFKLDEAPDYLAAWEQCRDREPVIRAESLDLPGSRPGLLGLWMLLPAADGASLIVVVDASTALDALQRIAGAG